MKPKHSLRKFILGSAIFATITTTQAATLYWDGTDTTADADGGAGTWNAANTNWDNAATGGANTAWNNALPDAAVFGGTAGTVSLGAARAASGVTINTGGYVISNSLANILTIGSGGITIGSGVGSSVQIGTGVLNTGYVALSASQQWTNNSNQNFFNRDGDLQLGAHTLTFSSPGGGSIIAASTTTGSGSIIVGSNTTVSMSGNNTYSGTTTVNSGGILIVNSFGNANANSGLGNKGATDAATNLVIDGGTLRVQVNSATSNRLFTVGAGGATFESMLTGAVSGQILLSGSTAITYADVGNRTLTFGGNSDDAGGSSIARTIGDVGGGDGIVALAKTGTHSWTVSGTNTYSGGTTVSAGTLTMGSASALGSTSGQLTVNGGTLNMAGNNLTVGNLTGSGGVISGTSGARTLTIGQGNGTGGDFQGAIQNGASGTTALTKTGNGAITLSGTNTYGGVTNVNDGILRVNGTHTTGGTYTVAAAGELQGTGSTTSALNVSGVLSPGASVETFESGALSMLNGSTFEYEVNSSVASGSGADLQVVSGALNLSGTVTLTLTDLASMDTAYGDGTVFSLINYSGLWNGGLFTFDGDEIGDGETFTAGLNSWRLDYEEAVGGLNFEDDHIAGSFVNITAVPEPSAALLGGLGLLALLRRRRQN